MKQYIYIYIYIYHFFRARGISRNFYLPDLQNFAFFNSDYINGSVQDCSNSSVLAMELLQYCAKPSIYDFEENFAKIELPKWNFYSQAVGQWDILGTFFKRN